MHSMQESPAVFFKIVVPNLDVIKCLQKWEESIYELRF